MNNHDALIAAILTTLLGSGSVVAGLVPALLNRRAKADPVPTVEVPHLDAADQWREFAAEMRRDHAADHERIERLEQGRERDQVRISALERTNQRLLFREQLHVIDAQNLRRHIELQLPPPAPDPPAGLND